MNLPVVIYPVIPGLYVTLEYESTLLNASLANATIPPWVVSYTIRVLDKIAPIG
jgi:hypothetical protein